MRGTSIIGFIETEVRPNVIGDHSYVTRPHVVLNHGMQSFSGTADRIEIVGQTEAEAIERAFVFLEHRFSDRAATVKRQPSGKRVPLILAGSPLAGIARRTARRHVVKPKKSERRS